MITACSLLVERKATQELIIKLLERKGLWRVQALLTASDSDCKCAHHMGTVIRNLAAKFLVELAWQNEKAQMMICECFSFTPILGQVALNPIPKAIQEKLRKNPSLFAQLHCP